MKTVFISYLQAEVDNKKIKQLIYLLEKSNINVIIDDRDLKIGDDLPLFMEKNLVESDFIIVILTSGYKKRADDRQGGVGYEASIMAASLSKNEASEKFLPVMFETYRDEIVPVFLSSKFSADLSAEIETKSFTDSFEKLKMAILGLPKRIRKSRKVTASNLVIQEAKKRAFIKKNEDKKNANLVFDYLCDHEPVFKSQEGLTGLVEIVNHNSLPIREVFIFLTSNRSYGELNNLLVINGYKSMYYLENLAPGEIHIECFLNGGTAGPERDAVAIIFSDVSGNVWYKDTRGKLYEITERRKNKFLASNGLFPPYILTTNVDIK